MSPTPEPGRVGRFVYLANNWISRVGILVAIVGAVAWLLTLPAGGAHPYLGLLTALILPGFVILGLSLLALGMKKKELHRKRRGSYPDSFPSARFADPEFRHFVSLVGVATLASLILGSHLTYSSLEYMESVEFCGQSCHIMQPEFIAAQYAPHSQAPCVDCHIREGFGPFVKAKINGTKQLYETLTGTYPTPIPTPVHDLAQGEITCGKCHSDIDFGERRREWIQFREDEENSAFRTELLLQVGGGSNRSGAHGAHYDDNVIEYWSDDKRTTVSAIRLTRPDGAIVRYARADSSSPKGEPRTMDCTDCHNRAAHSFEPPDKALDESLAAGRIDSSLPFIKREGLKLLQADYDSREVARDQLPIALGSFYEGRQTSEQVIQEAAQELLAIYERNVFPEFGVTWGTHPNHSGHEDYPGCFRCHNKELIASDNGHPIGDTCEDCHQILAVDQPISRPSVPLLTESPIRDPVPAAVVYRTVLGDAPFDHAEHVREAGNDCTACHNRLFRMRRGRINYGADLHRTAEAAGASCAGCHVAGGEAFASSENCNKCHAGLSDPIMLSKAPSPEAARLPGRVAYETSLGEAWFDHAQHVSLAKGDCAACHNQLFPMEEAPLEYGDALHSTAEAARSSCAGCHVVGGEAFGSEGNCQKCHDGLGEPKTTPTSGLSGIPEALSYTTRLGPAKFGHERHVDLAKGDCKICHNAIFPLEKGLLNYADNLHRTSEQTKTSCGACHAVGREAFESEGHCLDCHAEPIASAQGSAMGLPKQAIYPSRLGDVAFNHDLHIEEAGGRCSDCHNSLFPMAKVSLSGYADDYHREAETAGSSCAACHAPEKESFGSLNNCDRCHEGLELKIGQRAGASWFLPAQLVFLPLQLVPVKPERFIGSEKCAVCHPEESTGFSQDRHAVLSLSKRWESEQIACEACHGPGFEHVLALEPSELEVFGEAQPEVVNRTCLECHAADTNRHDFDQHARAGVACTGCHTVHGVSEKAMLAREVDAVCSQCHTAARAEFNRPFRHKLDEGAVSCVDCHNPHGEAPPAQMARISGNETGCLKCHSDKRGPFPFEHAPVRLEPCSSCHEPHGSANPRMLTRHLESQLCLECHAMTDGSLGGAPTGFHDLRSARFRNCSTCHTKIHGSFASRDFLR